MKKYSFQVTDTPVEFVIHNKDIVWPGYDFDNEYIAYTLTGKVPPHVLFLLGVRALLRDISVQEFSQRFSVLKEAYDHPSSDPELFSGESADDLLEFVHHLREGYSSVSDSTSPHLLDFLISLDDERLRESIAQSKYVLPQTLARLSKSKNRHVRINVALNALTPPAVLRELAHDNDKELTKLVIANPACPLDIQLEYIKDPRNPVRYCLAIYTTFPEIMEILVNDPYVEVRKGLLSNLRLPFELKKKLAVDKEASVRRKALMHITNHAGEDLSRRSRLRAIQEVGHDEV